MRCFSCVLFLFFLPFLGFGQSFSVERLHKISVEQSQKAKLNEADVASYITKFNQTKRVMDLGLGKKAVLKSIENGNPQYVYTHNLQARSTSGVDRIQSTTGLNATLKGKNITIGVWDGGHVLADHVELIGRVTKKDVYDINNHATHVAGTIMASGVNQNALGMAPEAEILSYYAFNDDLGSMALEAARGLVLSNHSYGLVLGWNYDQGNESWIWFGGTGDVDERFGHYSANSQTIDDIAYNAPYYTMVWSAGNDRNDVGDGTKPADGPHNCIGPSAVAKNVITVGAITGFDEFIDESSIIMSDFSSWGPTNDGRIKPDIVADGVNLLSTSSSGVDGYTTLSGTSMSAPSVTGSLAVLQQYYRQQNDTFMTAALLKSVIIHSARESGDAPGPDMVYGWGVLNTFDALEILQNSNGVDTLLIDSVLNDQQIIEYELFSDGILPITATLVWTDVPGIPGAVGDNNLLLINDLDIRLIDDEGTEVSPWLMDPSNSLIAQRGDNFRDNVERINFYQPKSRRYRIRISHKGALVNSKQAFALTITGGVINPSPQSENYWIASSGDFGLSTNWSQESGGVPSTVVSLASSSLIFDNNSVLVNGDVIKLNGNLSVENFIWLSNKQATLDLMGDTLTITGQFKIYEENLTIKNGVLNYRSDKSEFVSLNFDGTDNCTLLLNINSDITITSNIMMYKLVHQKGELKITNKSIQISKLIIQEAATLSLQENTLLIADSLLVQTQSFQASSNVWNFGGTAFSSSFPLVLNDQFQINGSSVFVGTITVDKLIVNSNLLTIYNHLSVDSLLISEGSDLLIFEGDTIEISSYIDILSSASNKTIVRGSTPSQKAQFIIGFRNVLCFDDLNISNIIVLSKSVFNAGTGSILANTTNIEQSLCDEIVFSDFTLISNCANSVLEIINLSKGDITNYNWTFGSGIVLDGEGTSTPEVLFLNEGQQTIVLEVSGQSLNHTYTLDVEIVSNELESVEIAKNSDGLVSSKEGDSYGWYIDGKGVLEETGRFLTPQESGSYRVAYYVNDTACLNRISDLYMEVVTSLEGAYANQGVEIYPNPFVDKFRIQGLKKNDAIMVYNMMGNLVYNNFVETNETLIDLSGYATGIYLVKISRKNYLLQKTLLKIK